MSADRQTESVADEGTVWDQIGASLTRIVKRWSEGQKLDIGHARVGSGGEGEFGPDAFPAKGPEGHSDGLEGA